MKKQVLLLLSCAWSLFAQETTIPTFDMRDFSNPEKKEQAIEGIRDALHSCGFFSLTNTGLDIEVIRQTFNTAQEFFALPFEEKMKISGQKTNFQRGYIPMYQESAKGQAVGDFKEFLHIGRERDLEHAKRINSWPNLWPDYFDLKTNVARYRNLLDDNVLSICHLLAEALGEEEDFFDEGMEDSESLLRIIHYPAPKSLEQQGAIWAAAHTDIDLFTILPQATADGLEVELPDGRWIPVRAEKDSVIINAGDFLEILSNGYFKSSVHRVKSPSGNTVGERYSMVYFAHPQSGFILSPREQWIAKTGGKPLYATATRWEMLMERLADLNLATDEMLKELAECRLMERLMQYGRESKDALKALCDSGYASDEVLKRYQELE